MEHSIFGPVIFGFVAAILTMGIIYFLAVKVGALPPRGFFDGFCQWALIITCGVVIGVLSGGASERFFNANYYAQMEKRKEERFKSLVDGGYEYWSLIESRPIQKSKIHSCHGTSLVTDREYKEIDVESKEVKESKARLHVFCKLDKKGDV